MGRSWKILAIAILTCVLVMALTPYLWVILTSFKGRLDILSPQPTWFFTPTLANYPASRDSIESRAAGVVRDLPGRIVGSARPDEDGPVIVAVETRWGIQARCVTAELRGDATVLTEVHSGEC